MDWREKRRRENRKTDLIFGFVIVLALVAVVVFYLSAGNWYCNTVRFPDVEARMEILGGFCMVNTESGWVPEERYRVAP